MEGRSDIGVIHESFIFLELKKLLKANNELRFWRTKQADEVDFIWIEDQVPVPIEVKTTPSKSSHPKGLIKFMNSYDCPFGYVFNKNRNEDCVYGEKIIRYRKYETVYDEFSKREY